MLEPVFHQGRQIGAIRKYSDALLIMLLKGKMRDMFGERPGHTWKRGKTVLPDVTKLSDEELRQEFLKVASALGFRVVDAG